MPSYANHTFRYDHYEDRATDEGKGESTRKSQRSSRRVRVSEVQPLRV